MQSQDHSTGRKEEQGFEESVDHKMEYCSGVRADTNGQKHISDLADGGISKHSLDIVLCQCSTGTNKKSSCSDDGYNQLNRRSNFVQHMCACQQVNTSCYHCCSMDHGTHR